MNIAPQDSNDETDPKVEYLIQQIELGITPAGYNAGLYTKLWEVQDKLKAGEREIAQALVDALLREINAIPANRVTPEEVEGLIRSAN